MFFHAFIAFAHTILFAWNVLFLWGRLPICLPSFVSYGYTYSLWHRWLCM